MLKRSMI